MGGVRVELFNFNLKLEAQFEIFKVILYEVLRELEGSMRPLISKKERPGITNILQKLRLSEVPRPATGLLD